jgi:hypothetical protein
MKRLCGSEMVGVITAVTPQKVSSDQTVLVQNFTKHRITHNFISIYKNFRQIVMGCSSSTSHSQVAACIPNPSFPIAVLSGLELWLDVLNKDTLEIDADGSVLMWTSCANNRKLVSLSGTRPILSNINSKQSVEFDYNKTMDIVPPLTNIQTIISFHRFKDTRPGVSPFYILCGSEQGPFHGDGNFIASEQHGGYGQGLPFCNGVMRLNGVVVGPPKQITAWKESFQVATVLCQSPVPVNRDSRCVDRIGRDRVYHEFPGFLTELLVYNRELSTVEVEAVEEYLFQKYFPGGNPSHSPISSIALTRPTTSHPAASYNGDLIIINGVDGWYEYTFPCSASTYYLSIKYAAQDQRNLIVAVDGVWLGEFHLRVTGGWNSDRCQSRLFGPFCMTQPAQLHRLYVTTNKFFFPHVQSISIFEYAGGAVQSDGFVFMPTALPQNFVPPDSANAPLNLTSVTVSQSTPTPQAPAKVIEEEEELPPLQSSQYAPAPGQGYAPSYAPGPEPGQGYAPAPGQGQGYAPGASGPGQGQGYAPAPGQGYAPAPGQGYAPAPGQGYAPAPGQGYAPAPGQGYAPGPGQGQGYAPAPGQGYAPAPGQGYAPGPGQGYAPGPGQGYAPAPGQGYAPAPGQGYAPGPGQGYAPGPGQGYAPGPGQGYAPGPGQGQFIPQYVPPLDISSRR